MRGGRSFLILLAVALGLGAYIYFIEAERDPTGTSVVPGEKVFAVEAGTIEEVQVQAVSGDTTTLRRSGDGWQIVEPTELEADTSAVSSLVSTLESLESQRIVDENPESFSQYGLDPARMSIAFRAAGETAMRRLLLGERTPTGADLYARVEGEPRLLLIASYLEDSLNKTTFDLRDKSVLKFERDGVDALTLDAGSRAALQFTRQGDDWRITAPVDAKADFSTVDGLIGRMFQARMQSIVAPDEPGAGPELAAADLREYGLDSPAVTATFGSGSSRAVLAVGSETDTGARYARDLSRPMVFTIDSALYDELARAADEFRSKDVFAFRSFTAQGVELTLDGDTFTFTREAAPAGDTTTTADTWKQTAPEARDVDQATMTDLLTTLSNLRAESFAARPASSGQELVVTARFGDAASPRAERVVLRKSGDTVHALVEGEPGAAIVPTADFDRVLSLLKDITGAQ